LLCAAGCLIHMKPDEHAILERFDATCGVVFDHQPDPCHRLSTPEEQDQKLAAFWLLQ